MVLELETSVLRIVNLLFHNPQATLKKPLINLKRLKKLSVFDAEQTLLARLETHMKSHKGHTYYYCNNIMNGYNNT